MAGRRPSKIGYIVTQVLPFVTNRKCDLGLGANAPQGKLPDHGTFIHLLKEARSEHIGDFKCRPDNGIRQVRSVAFVSIRGPRR